MTTPVEVYQAVGTAIGLLSSLQSPRQVVTAIGDRSILVLLDNCEHLIEPAAVIAEAILHSNPHAHILATSREALRADWEHVIAIPPLEFPDEDVREQGLIIQAGAVKLFLNRAIASGFNGALDPSSYVAIAEICRRLDGIPLAIELAAARVSALGIHELKTRLQDRFRLLSGGAPNRSSSAPKPFKRRLAGVTTS